jgi:pimeloyl-ACP methyl ester carboxylesterase
MRPRRALAPRLRLLLIAIITLSAGCFSPSLPRNPQDLGGEHVSFRTSDGVLLRGHLYGRGRTGVILAHMYPADQSDWTDFARVLAGHGYEALTFDFRGFTESEGESGTEYADRDLMAAYKFLRPRVSRIFIAGASLGSEAAILLAAHEQVAGIICISTPTSFGGLDVTKAITQVRAAILFVTSKDDPLVAGQPEILYRIADAPKSFETYPGKAHGTSILFGPYGNELQNLMLRFIAANDAPTG